MTRHDLYTAFDLGNNPISICRVCGTVFAADTPLSVVEASECGGAVYSTHSERYDTCRIPYHPDTFVSDFVSFSQQLRNGNDLLDQWLKEQGE